MKKPTKVLSDEHQNILKIINALAKECDALLDGKEINKDFFSKAIDFIRNYADKFHHIKEEDILFVELGKDTVELDCNPMEQMLREHEEGRNFVKGIEEGVNENNKEKIIENSKGYVYLLRDHIFKEDNILYPMADELLNQQIQDSIMEKFEKAEENKFNQEFKNKYLAIADEFEKKKKD